MCQKEPGETKRKCYSVNDAEREKVKYVIGESDFYNDL